MKKQQTPRPPRRPLDAAQLWAEVEDYSLANARVWMGERVVYFHLIRLTRLVGKRTLRTSIGELSRAVHLSKPAVRLAVRRLAGKGVVRILNRSYDGHILQVRTPREQKRSAKKQKTAAWWAALRKNCIGTRATRQTIFDRDGHRCFYCLRQLAPRRRALDHVVPRIRRGRDGYLNIVACCVACNTSKNVTPAVTFVRRLYRKCMLSPREFHQRLSALRALQQGKLKPAPQSKLLWPH